jgi:hypothetical protein
MFYYCDMKKPWNLTIKIYTFVDGGRRRCSWKGKIKNVLVMLTWQRCIATENTQRMLTIIHRCRRSCRVLKEKKNICLNTKLVIEIFSCKSIHTRFISSLPFCSPSWRLGTFTTANLMDIALVSLEWEYVPEYFTTNFACIFPFGTTSLVNFHMPVQSILEIIKVDIISSKYFSMFWNISL